MDRRHAQPEAHPLLEHRTSEPRGRGSALEPPRVRVSPSLQTIKMLLATRPDAKLLDWLRITRGQGRDDDPARVLWGVVVLRIVLRPITTEAVLAERRGNEGLRRLNG